MATSDEIKFRYVFSGTLTDTMHDILLDLKDFKPLDILVSQIDRSGLTKSIKWKHEGFCRWLFCDSGAFSVHTGKQKVTQEDYINYINEIFDDIDVFAQLDTIPGSFGKPKSTEDYINSAESSWENFLHMRECVPDPQKIMPVYHFGEDIKYLIRMLDFVDSRGNKLDYIGLSPANDASVNDRMKYLQNMYDVIKSSSNPDVKTHVYGFTSLNAMSKFPCYSADSISHRLISGYNKILTKEFGIISTSRRPRSVKVKSNLSFLETCDDYNKDKLRKELEDLGITIELAEKYGFKVNDILDWVSEDNNVRVAITMKNIQILSQTKYKYHENNLLRQRKLF